MNEGKHAIGEATSQRQEKWLEKASRQLELPSVALEAIDRCVGLEEGDILVCETTCLAYAAHALEHGAGELWIVPPTTTGEGPSTETLDAFRIALKEEAKGALETLVAHGSKFRGIVDSVPNKPFKLLITTSHVTDDQSPLEWPLYNKHWVGMCNTDGSMGAVIYLPAGEASAEPEYVCAANIGGTYDTQGFSCARELPGGYVVLSTGGSLRRTGLDDFSDAGIDPFLTMLLSTDIRLEDLSDPDAPWAVDATEMTLCVNGGCVTPSVVRAGVEVIEETTLGNLASRVSRGTTLSEKKLDVKERLDDRARREAQKAERSVWAMLGPNVPYPADAFAHVDLITSDIWASARDDDLYYVDGTCFRDGRISPTVLNSMPNGQERYIVHDYDGEVLLVSRNSKEFAMYSATRPTLIGNSVFVVRLDPEVNREYLACWMRGSYAKEWLNCGGKMLTKRALVSLPVPILTQEVMERTVSYERAIDEQILELSTRVAQLKARNRFAPLTAVAELK